MRLPCYLMILHRYLLLMFTSSSAIPTSPMEWPASGMITSFRILGKCKQTADLLFVYLHQEWLLACCVARLDEVPMLILLGIPHRNGLEQYQPGCFSTFPSNASKYTLLQEICRLQSSDTRFLQTQLRNPSYPPFENIIAKLEFIVNSVGLAFNYDPVF